MAEAVITEFVTSKLLGEIQNIIEKAVICKDTFIKIKEKLEDLAPLFEDIIAGKKKLDRPPLETKKIENLLKQGQQLVAEYRKIKRFKYFYKRPNYTTRLLEWDESLKQYLQERVPVETARDVNEILESLQTFMTNPATTTEKNNVVVPDPIDEVNNFREDFSVGLDEPFKDLKIELLKDDKRVLVLTAPPGCGKTTLAEKFIHDQEIRDKFNIMFVTVSRTPNLSLIAQQLYNQCPFPVPSLPNNDDPIAAVSETLLKKIGNIPMLLVFDDVWSGSEWLIDKFCLPMTTEYGKISVAYKILVTSRSKLPHFGSSYEMKGLSDDDAMTLFRHYAILKNESSNIPDDDVMEKVVQHCKKVPLALKLVGALLRGYEQEIWEEKLEEWSGDSSVLSTFQDELLSCLKSSLDFMGGKDAKLKECFLDLASFPEDKRIPATALIDMWTELHGLTELSAAANLFKLHHWNMANLVIIREDAYEKDGYYIEHFVTQHDMLRDLAIHQSRQEEEPEEKRKRLILELNGKNRPKWWHVQNSRTFNARIVSITTDDKFTSKWCNMKLPEAEVLILNFLSKNYALPDFLKTMTQLKVLIITNHGPSLAKISNFELLGSLTNLKRIRFERVAIPSLSKTSIMWENLQKLSFFMCKVSEAFGYIQESEPFPNLEELNIDYCADLVELPAGFCEMVKDVLVKLSITHCHKLSRLPEEIGKMNNLQVLRFRSCIGLENLPDSICRLHRLAFLDLSDCFSIRNLPEDIGDLCSLKKLNIKGCARLQGLPESILEFKQLKDVVCDEELKELWESSLTYYSEVEIKFSISTVNLKLAKEDINLNWLKNMYS